MKANRIWAVVGMVLLAFGVAIAGGGFSGGGAGGGGASAFGDLTGTADIAQGGTTETQSTEDAVLVGASTTNWVAKVLTDCDAVTSAVTYDTTTNAFACNVLGTATDDAVMVGTGAALAAKVLTDCDAASSAVTYDTTANAFGCNTIAAGTVITDTVTMTGTASTNTITSATTAATASGTVSGITLKTLEVLDANDLLVSVRNSAGLMLLGIDTEGDLTGRSNSGVGTAAAPYGWLFLSDSIYDASTTARLSLPATATTTVSGAAANGASAVGVVLKNSNSFSTAGAKSVSIRNGGTEIAFVGFEGGIRPSAGTPGRPTCDETHRGQMFYVQAAGGAADTMEWCKKDAGDSYAWTAF